MMFLVRSAFWLAILVLLIPTDEAQQKRLYGTAQTAWEDISKFCDRNPNTCVSSKEAFDVLVQKAQYGAEMIQSLVDDHGDVLTAKRPSSPATPSDATVMPVPSAVPIEPTPWMDNGPQNTLRPQDLETDWSGPNV